MHTTPFKHVNYHKDGRHVFTVNVGDEVKRFVSTETINAEQALLNALRWRDSVTGVSMAEPDKPKIGWYVKSIDEPDMVRPIKITPVKPEPRKMVIPDAVRARLEGTTTPPVKKPVTRNLPLKAMVEGRNRKYPSLPSGVNPLVTTYLNGNAPALSFVVNYRLHGKAATKTFYLGTKHNVTLAKYRVIRFVAVKFRQEYLMSVAEKREMDLEAFANYYTKLLNGNFRWPFKGTVPPKLTTKKAVNGRSIHQFQTERMSGQNPKHPSLPIGVQVVRQRKEGKTDQILFQVTYADNRGKTKTKTYYVGLAGHLDLRRYRMARHVAIAFRKEYLDARISRRAMRLELFDDWKEKIITGTFFVPFNRTPTDIGYVRTVTPSATTETLLNSRAGQTAQNILATLRRVPELTATLNELSPERLTEIALMIHSPVNQVLYARQKK
jgi:hypothetical protein